MKMKVFDSYDIKPNAFTTIKPDKLDDEPKKSILTQFYEGFAPLYAICRMIGIFPLKAKRIDTNIHMEAEKNDRVYMASYVSSYVLLTIYSIYAILVDEINYVIVPKMLVLTESLIIILLMFMTMFFCYWYRKLLMECVHLMSDVDLTLPNLNVHVNYVSARKNNFNVFGIMLMSVMIRSLIMIGTIRVDFLQQLTLFIATFIKSLSKYEFIALLLPITVRFNKINGAITSYANRREDPKLTEHLYILCRLHFKVCNISRLLNSSFAFQLLSSLGVSLTDILFQSFYLYTVLTKRMNIATWTMVASPIVWLIDEFLEIYLLVNACSTTCETANNTAILLHELRNSVKKNEVDVHIQMYSLQMLHQKLEFSALGFFSIDYSLLYSILGAVTTYLVIFIQFDQSQDAKEQLALHPKVDNCTSLIAL